MRIRKSHVSAPPPAEATVPHRNKPPWADLIDSEERPNREDLAANHNVFTDSMLAPVPLPRWLRGRRPQPPEKAS